MKPSEQRTLADIRDAHQHHTLRLVVPILAIFYLLTAAAHWTLLQEPARTQMTVVAGTTAILFAVLGALRDHPRIVQHPRLGTAALSLLVWVNCTGHMAITGEPIQTTNLILMVVGASVLFVDSSVFWATLVLAAAGFTGSAMAHPGDPLWVHFGFALFAAEILAGLMYLSQRNAFRRRFEAETERERVELERRLRASEALAHESRYRAVVSLSPAAIIVHRKGTVLFANRAAADLVGAKKESELVGSRLYDLFEPEKQDEISAWHDGALAEVPGERRIACRLRAIKGSWPYVELAAAAFSWEYAPAALIVATDVTARTESERLQGELTSLQETLKGPVGRALEALGAEKSDEAVEQLTVLSRILTSGTPAEPY